MKSRKSTMWNCRYLYVISFQVMLVISVSAQKFTLPVLPDTQVEVNAKPEMFMSQMQWLADKRDSLKAPMVLHVGDIVDYNNDLHYEKATKGFALLDKAKIPYAVCLGNHDTDAVGENTGSAAPGNTNKNLRQTPKFNKYYPVSRFRNQKERFEENKSDNSAHVFIAGGVKWLVVSLEFCARKEPVEWANSVIAKYPKHNVIILTHSHLTAKGTIDQRNAGYGDLSPQQIFDMMIKKHANVRFVLCGHTGTSTYRVDQGEHGNNIYQILQDYQGQDYGGGYIRLLEIDTKTGTVNGKMYSPYYNKTKDDYSVISFTGVKFIGKKSKS